MSKNAISPIEKKRVALLKEMTPATRQVAEDFETRLGRGAQGIILIQYDMGSRVAEVMENEGEYGSGAIKQISEYLNIAGGETTLYALRNFAESFDKDYVKELSAKPMSNGQFLSVGHWFKVMQLRDRKTQDKIFDRIFRESLTVNELEKEIRGLGTHGKKNARQGGGRKPATPTSPIAGLQTAFQIAQKWANLEPVLEESVFDAIDELPPDRVNEALLEKLQQTKEKLDEMVVRSQSASDRVTANIERVEKVLSAKTAEADEDNESESENEDTGKKAKKGKKGKAESNGEATEKKGKKGKKTKKEKVAAE